jgi:hypothetical protein
LCLDKLKLTCLSVVSWIKSSSTSIVSARWYSLLKTRA